MTAELLETLCLPEPEVAEPARDAGQNLYEMQAPGIEPARGAGTTLQEMQVEPAPRAKELEQGTRTRGTRREGWDGAPAFGESTAPEPSLDPSFGEDDHPLCGARNLGYNEPLPDPDAEASAVDVVNRVNLLGVRRGRNPVTDEARPHWLKSSRLLLSRHPVEEVARLIDWAGRRRLLGRPDRHRLRAREELRRPAARLSRARPQAPPPG